MSAAPDGAGPSPGVPGFPVYVLPLKIGGLSDARMCGVKTKQQDLTLSH